MVASSAHVTRYQLLRGDPARFEFHNGQLLVSDGIQSIFRFVQDEVMNVHRKFGLLNHFPPIPVEVIHLTAHELTGGLIIST